MSPRIASLASHSEHVIDTHYGVIKGVVSLETYETGELRSCILKEENIIATAYGTLVPQYKKAEYGERQKKYRSAIAFHKNGSLKSVALEEQMPIQTPIGTFPAELVTFYKDGALNRIFPLNGKIDGFWSEENEGERAQMYHFDLKVGAFDAKIIGLHFYPSGALKSLTLWPGERITIQTTIKPMEIRNGFSLYEDGQLKSTEPAGPTRIETAIGDVMAYDLEALGIHADENSLMFAPDGELISLKTTHTGISVRHENGIDIKVEPYEVISIIDDAEMTTVPLHIEFNHSQVILTDMERRVFSKHRHQFSVYKKATSVANACGSCSSCHACG